MAYQIYTIKETAKQIYSGNDPWLALGNFLNDWWGHAEKNRQTLINEPPDQGDTLEDHQWAAFCAASVEELCKRTAFPCPKWINQPEFFLTNPWFYDGYNKATLEPFARRNIFVPGNTLDSKYELKQRYDDKPWKPYIIG